MDPLVSATQGDAPSTKSSDLNVSNPVIGPYQISNYITKNSGFAFLNVGATVSTTPPIFELKFEVLNVINIVALVVSVFCLSHHLIPCLWIVNFLTNNCVGGGEFLWEREKLKFMMHVLSYHHIFYYNVM